MVINKELIKLMPKTDLHCHLDGSMRLETLLALAQEQGMALPSTDPLLLRRKLGFGILHEDLSSYIRSFEVIIALMQKKEAILRVTEELCEDAAREQVWHLEIRFCPMLLTKKGLKAEEVVEAAALGAKNAMARFPMTVGIILCALRHHDPAEGVAVAKLAARFAKDGVTGFDIAGPEKGFPIRPFLEAILIAKKGYVPITIHAGESFGPVSIAEAIFEGGCARIGHGTTLIQDERLLQLVVDWGIAIEACPSSNLHTGAVASIGQHPIRRFLLEGAKVSINTDNRLVSDTNVSTELLRVSEQLDFTLAELRTLLENGFKTAFLPHQKRAWHLGNFAKRWQEVSQMQG